jgi:hypothetical protein
LDRQHPRDLFDVKLILDNEGITDEIRKAFVIYLASHDRPIHELLDPAAKNIRRIYGNEFAGMTVVSIPYQDLIAARVTLIETLRKELTGGEREFLVSLKAGQPKWNSIGIEGVENLPAVQWKLSNIRKMSAKKQSELLENSSEYSNCERFTNPVGPQRYTITDIPTLQTFETIGTIGPESISNGLNGAQRLNVLNDLNGLRAR